MCLAILSDEYVRFDLAGEYIALSVEDGSLTARETYDFFFSVKDDISGLLLYCISPHDLTINSDLQVLSVEEPEGIADETAFYRPPIGHGAFFEHGLLTVTLPSSDPSNPRKVQFDGDVVVPTPRLACSPEDSSALRFMASCGTCFLLRFPPLSAGTRYMFRLVVTPQRLLSIPPRRHALDYDLLQLDTTWIQNISVYDPKTCHFNYCKLLSQGLELDEFRAGAAGIEAIVRVKGRSPVPTKRHRILLTLPEACDIQRESVVGCCSPVGTYAAAGDGRHVVTAEWIGGSDEFPNDDIETTTDRIYHYLVHWGFPDPKSKEAITSALSAPHTNVSRIVDSLEHLGGLTQISGTGLYNAKSLDPDKVDEILKRVAKDTSLNNQFDWTGFEIRLALQYFRMTDKAKALVHRVKFFPVYAIIASMLALIVSLLCIILRAVF